MDIDGLTEIAAQVSKWRDELADLAKRDPHVRKQAELAINLRVYRIARELRAAGFADAAAFVDAKCDTGAMPFFKD